jgi:F-type H+-transporting ATPase subunit alpha
VIARALSEPYLNLKEQTASFCTPWNATNACVPDSTDVWPHACDDQLVHPELISTAIRARLGSGGAVVDIAQAGQVISIGDGIARVSGVESAMLGEMLEFPGGLRGIALNLEEERIGFVLLGRYGHIKEGDAVRRTGRIISVPVGDALLGRVVNGLGQPLDGKGRIATLAFAPIERLAPGVVERQPVREPLQTGTPQSSDYLN